MQRLPSFLEPLEKHLPGQPSTQPAHYVNAVFRHNHFSSLSHALWWPSKPDNKRCLIFVTGNPGLLDFYTPFLTAIHEKSGGSINILGHALIGHTPGIEDPAAGVAATCLTAQVEGLIEILDAVNSQYNKVTIAGHSIGSWLILQTLKARPEHIHSVILLFPTVCHISDTPNGSILTRFFRHPWPTVLSWSSVLLKLLPTRVMSWVYKDWPADQLQVLHAFLRSSSSIYNALTLANDEMNTVKDLDVALLQEYRHRIHLYFGESDNWVGKHRETIIGAFPADEDSIKIVRGHPDIPHSFCINHGEQVAEQCYQWLRATYPS